MKPRIANMVDALTVYVRGRAQSDGYLSTIGGYPRDGKYTAAIRQATQLFVKSQATAEEDPLVIEVVSNVIASTVQRLSGVLQKEFDDERINFINDCVEKAWQANKVWRETSRKDNKINAWEIFISQINLHSLSGPEAYLVCVLLAQKLCPLETAGFSREIFFTPENQQAGIGILNYFSVILRQKLPSSDASVSIRQEKDRVILKISYPDGTGEEVCQLFDEYRLVLTGQKTADEFLSSPVQAMALKQKLELAQLELRHTREILGLERSANSQRQSNLENDVLFLRQQLAIQMQSNSQLTASLISRLESSNGLALEPLIRDTIESLVQAVIAKDRERMEDVAKELATASPDVFNRLSEFILSNTFGGVIGNAAYAWLLPIWPAVLAALSR